MNYSHILDLAFVICESLLGGCIVGILIANWWVKKRGNDVLSKREE